MVDTNIAVAAGVPCLCRFVVPHSGRVLLYAAEDVLSVMRRRLEGIASAGVDLPARCSGPSLAPIAPACDSCQAAAASADPQFR